MAVNYYFIACGTAYLVSDCEVEKRHSLNLF